MTRSFPCADREQIIHSARKSQAKHFEGRFNSTYDFEPVAWMRPIAAEEQPPERRAYYTAQGNATRVFFKNQEPGVLQGWTVFHSEALASFSYLLSGGFSRPALYPAACRSPLQAVDDWLSRWPNLFGSRCLIGLEPSGTRSERGA